MKRKPGFVKHIANGKCYGYDFLAIELLGKSLGALLKDHGGSFGLATVSTIGIKLLDRLEVLHGQNIVHCDLKPDNITIGKEDTTELYLIDFGLSQTITDADELLEPFKINHILGSFIFLSTSAHNGIVSF